MRKIYAIFFIPDFTVGTGISPVLLFCSRTYATAITADVEFHQPLKIKIVNPDRAKCSVRITVKIIQ